jgi:hypothetical protein
MSIDNIAESLNGLFVGVPYSTIPLGTSSGTDSRSVTPSAGQTLVGETESSGGSFWDFLGKAAGDVAANSLVQRYVDGKITKELLNDGVPLYTTYGNPNDQAGGKLLQDTAVSQANASKTYLLVGGGILAALVVVYLVARK